MISVVVRGSEVIGNSKFPHFIT